MTSFALPPLDGAAIGATAAATTKRGPRPVSPVVIGAGGESQAAAYSEAPSENVHVCTPERELEIIRAFAPIGLDPCGNATSTVRARVEFWGPPPTCAICGEPATCGASNSSIDRCAAHIAARRDAKDTAMRRPISREILADARYGRDGLVESWVNELRRVDGEIAFWQPPYGRYIKPWVPKAAVEARAGAEIIGLLPGRFDTQWFRGLVVDRICWYGRRIPFIDHTKPDMRDSAKFPSVITYVGPHAARFESHFNEHGVVTPWKTGR